MEKTATTATPVETPIPEPVVGQKRVRTGETFIEPSEVTLHCHDFTFEALKASLIVPSPEEKGPRNAATPAPPRGFHMSPSALKAEVKDDDDGASSFIYYGAVPWVKGGSSGSSSPSAPPCPSVVSCELASFAELHDVYSGACSAMLEQSLKGTAAPSVAAPAPTTGFTPAVSPWEKHYELTTNNFFPIKNYIHRAFPTLMGSGDDAKRDAIQAEGTCSSSDAQPPKRLIMEVGCGNGSAILTFLRHCPNDDYVCFDISSTAVRLLDEHAITKGFIEARAEAQKGVDAREEEKATRRPPLTTFVYDICDSANELDEAFLTIKVKEMLANKAFMYGDNGAAAFPNDAAPLPIHPTYYRRGTVDQMLLIFVLCALPSVEAMRVALRRMAYWLKPGKFVGGGGAEGSSPSSWEGGRLLFRDYGVLDHNMLRFLERPAPSYTSKDSAASTADASSASASLVGPTSPFFIKGDGTSQFFFVKDFTIALFGSCGLVPIDVSYHCNEVKNRKNGKVMRKVFINAEFGVLAQ